MPDAVHVCGAACECGALGRVGVAEGIWIVVLAAGVDAVFRCGRMNVCIAIVGLRQVAAMVLRLFALLQHAVTSGHARTTAECMQAHVKRLCMSQVSTS